ncbi:PfkB family carbohydrate kinase [Streptomyces tricolor]|nr:PfkB family carbohydrate kinase [Streptomyces tricolor]
MIVVAGEALIDLVPQGPGALADLKPALGGGPYNTAVALGRLGSPHRLLLPGRPPTRFGEALLDGLRRAGVDVSGGAARPGADDARGGHDRRHGIGRLLLLCRRHRRPSVHRSRRAARRYARAVSFGTCSLVLEPGASAYEELIARGGRAGGCSPRSTPHIRAGLIPDADAYRARFKSWLPSVTLLKLSAEDAAWLGGSPRAWLAAGPAAVVVTRGGDGLTVFTRDGGEYSVPGEKVDVVDTIGAGDTVNAALLHGLAVQNALSAEALAALGAEGWTRLLRFAARAAAITCSRAGAEPPYAAELGEPTAL